MAYDGCKSWDCGTQGCYWEKKVIDFKSLCAKLPNKVGASDLDGCIERNGWLCIIETKSPGAETPLGQDIMFKNFTKRSENSIVFVVYTDDVTLGNVEGFSWYWHGELHSGKDDVPQPDESASERLFRYISTWFEMASAEKWQT